MENGPLTAIEIRASGAIDGLRARYSTILLLVSTVKSQAVDRCTEMRFASLLFGGFTTKYGSNKSNGRETGKWLLCLVCYLGQRLLYITACNFTVLGYCN